MLTLAFILFLGESAWSQTLGFKAKHSQIQSSTQMTITVALPRYELVEEGDWTQIKCESKDAASFLKEGEPELFSFTYFISIPAGTKVKSISIKPDEEIINLAKPIKPVPGPTLIGEKPKPLVPDPVIYQSSVPYPSGKLTYSYAKQGTSRMLVLTVYPFKFVGKNNTLVVARQMKITIFLYAREWKPGSRPINAVDRHLKSRLVNPDTAFFGQGGGQ